MTLKERISRLRGQIKIDLARIKKLTPKPSIEKTISDQGLRLIEQFEGFRSDPYQDSVGVWTRGYGETRGIGPHSGNISQAQAQRNLQSKLASEYEPAIRALHVNFNQNQWDALCSFVWNLGPGIFTGQLRSALVARNFKFAGDLMLGYDHAGGAVLPGLRARRETEVALFDRPV